MSKKDESVLIAALEEYKGIVNAAELNAKNKLAEEYSNKFNQMVKEELDKSKNKESYKKIDENEEPENSGENKKESVMKKETKKVEKEMTPKNGEKINENLADVNIGDNVDGDNLNTVDDIDNEISKLDEIIDEINKEENGDNDFENNSETENEGEMLADIKAKLDTLISMMGGEENGEDELEIDDSEFTVDENDEFVDSEINFDEIDFEDTEDEIEEGHGVSYPMRRNVSGRNLPNNEYLSQIEKDQSPHIVETKLKHRYSKLIEENKKLTKKVNTTNKINESNVILIEKYKDLLGKFKTQLQEMAVINTNIVNVNNLLVNEELALTKEDKIRIVNEFKTIQTVETSKEKYVNLLNEIKSSKNSKPIVETIEKNTIIESSSAKLTDKQLNEVTALNGVSRIKEMMNKIENRKK